MPQWSVPGYTELRALGSGGFGEVMLARHEASGVLVAIKYLRNDLLDDPGFAEMFRSEAAVLASLKDPNIVRLYEYVESSSGAAIVMELIDGVSLRGILANQGSTTAEAALLVLQGSLMGLAAAHRRNVVHRDYKPENVLVNGDGVSKLTDFGLAARTGARPFPAGTLSYVAPEQIAGAPASPAGDVYSATATFYECLTGRPPFRGESAEVLRQHRIEPVPVDSVPGPLRPLVAAGMAKDPRRRPADATTLVTELRTVASGAYGKDWESRGRSHLGEAALLLAALWPVGAPTTADGLAVARIPLLRRIAPGKAAIAVGGAVAIVAAGAILAANALHRPRLPSHPAAVVQPVSLQPPTSNSPTPSPSPSPTSLSPSPSPTSPAQPAPPAPDFYVHNGYELGALYQYPSFPKAIGLDNHDAITGLQWSNVSQTGGIAMGTLNVDNCAPNCASGSYVTYPIELLVSDPQQCTVQVYKPSSDVAEPEKVYVFNKTYVKVLNGSPPTSLVGSTPVLPPACGSSHSNTGPTPGSGGTPSSTSYPDLTITRVTTYQKGELVYFRIYYQDVDNDAEGFGFVGVDGSKWAEETHPFSSPSYGIVGPGTIAYPFNLACGTAQAYQSEVKAWIYDTTGARSRPVVIHLACTS